MNENNELESLKEEMRILKEELKSLKDNSNAKAFNLGDTFNNEEIIQDFQEEFSKIKDKTEEVSDDLKEQIKANPIQSISIAFTVGILLSKVFGGRR